MPAPLILLADDNAELVDLLAQVMEEAGYRTVVCHRGKAALEALEGERPALAILDILLPDVMGYEIAKVAGQKDVPVIFCTGVFKGGRHALDAARKFDCKGYFEKPFEAGKLLDTVKKLVPPPPPAPRRPAVDAKLEIELEIDIDEGEYTPAQPMDMTGRISVSGDNINAVLSGSDFKLNAPTRATTFVRPKPVPSPRPVTLERPADDEPAPPKPEEISSDGRTRKGELRDNLPQLITAFWQGQSTGELFLSRGKVRKVLVFEKGQPVFAQSNLAADRFGSFLVRIGKINEGQLKNAALAADAQKRRTGDVLIEMGLLKDAERMYYVAQQIKAIIYSVFAWEDGEYVVAFQDKARHEPIRLGIHPSHLIGRGIKKLYKPERLQRLLKLEDRLIPSPDPLFQLSELELEEWEAKLLTQVTGERNVAELLAMAGKPQHVVYATLASLLGLKVLEKREDVILE